MNQRVIQVAVPRPLHTVYDYAVPDDMPLPLIGARVKVPFGRSKIIGVCTANQVCSDYEQLKAVAALLDDEPLIDTRLMQLAQWMSEYYHHPLGEVLATMLPAAARRGANCAIDAPDFWQAQGATFDRPRAPAQHALFEFLRNHAPCAGTALVAAGHTRQTLRNLVNAGAASRCEEPSPTPTEEPPAPTPGQQQAIASITSALDGYQGYLLEGVTGSGKTEVYLRCMQPVVQAARQVLVLVPEIALTPQTLGRFQKRFARVGMLHSGLTDHERMQTWLKCRSGALDILIGTRSAVFTPFHNLGLIVVDEEHDASYKQQEGLRYSARDLATKRAHAQDVPIIFGSATPSLESLYNVMQGRYVKLLLPQRAGNAQMPTYHLIDMRGQTHTDGIAPPLERVIRQHLNNAGQVLVFLNRRGYAPSLLCASCGWVAACSDCDARLTLHQTPRQLVCHHCALRFEVPNTCAECGQRGLLPVGLGTQRTEQGLQNLFPHAPVYRIDRDTVRTTRQLEAQFDRINVGEPCIMVGTQMLAKGHHFPNVTLVAVLNADAGFLSPDFRAPERTAQLIVQVAGRAGRAARPGEVWIQTYQPDNPILRTLIEAGYDGFATAELANRISAAMPPIKPMAMLRAEAGDPHAALGLLNHCKAQLADVECLGPAPAPLARVAKRHRYQLMLIARNRSQLHRSLRQLTPPKLHSGLRLSIDIDPYDSL